MADQLHVIAFLLDAPGGRRRRRAMIKPIIPTGAPRTIEIPQEIEQSQAAISQYLAVTTSTPVENISWRNPLRR